jgi:hypothetical protein
VGVAEFAQALSENSGDLFRAVAVRAHLNDIDQSELGVLLIIDFDFTKTS